MAKANETTAAPETPVPVAAAVPTDVPTEGTRQRRVFMLKQFVPDADWINKNVVAKGKGTKVVLGRVFGVVMGYEDKQNILPDGSTSQSIVLKGAFQSESYLTGELNDATNVYLPMAYAEKVKAIMESNKEIRVVNIDCDIGLEATGKTIPYEWLVVAFREGEEMAVLKNIRNSRKRPDNAVALAAPDKAAQIEHKT